MTSLNVSFIILYFRENLDNIPTDAEELSFGNSVYKITFENRERPVFGHKYWFFLQDAVENVPEYVVRWDNFVQYVFHFTTFVFITVFFFPRSFPWPCGLFYFCCTTHSRMAQGSFASDASASLTLFGFCIMSLHRVLDLLITAYTILAPLPVIL